MWFTIEIECKLGILVGKSEKYLTVKFNSLMLLALPHHYPHVCLRCCGEIQGRVGKVRPGIMMHQSILLTTLYAAAVFFCKISPLLLLPSPKTHALSIFRPSGLTPQLVTSLAQKRYGGPLIMPPMVGRRVVITGAAGGIGQQLCNVIHSLGGTVVALDRNETGLELLQLSLPNVICIPTRHEDLASIAATADLIKKKFKTIDLLVNNAGLTYNGECIPGSELMKSKHGYDLAFTVNYLSHFLLVEKLMPCLIQSDKGRIVHMTSSYHWKVDGSELIPKRDMGPVAYQSDPRIMSARHISRSYANTKLAQIWHSRSIVGCESVCACPTWVATGIAGESNRSFLQKFAFPVEGSGISSALNAIFRTSADLGDALNSGHSFVANSRILEYIPFKRSCKSTLNV